MLADRVRIGSSIPDSGLVIFDYGNTEFDMLLGVNGWGADAPILQNDYIYFNHDGTTGDGSYPFIVFNVKVQDFTKITIEYRHEESKTLVEGWVENVVSLNIYLNKEFNTKIDQDSARIRLAESISKTIVTVNIPNNNEDRYLGLSTDVYYGEYGGYANIYKIILHN